MLLILPPSESKRPPPAEGDSLDLGGLSFPALGPMRERILEALIETSAGLDAFSRLGVRPTLAADVARNTRLREVPVRPVLDVYTGPLHEGLDSATLSPAARDRAAREVVVASALWGVLRPVDRIPAYRLHPCARLVGMERLEPTWRTVLPEVLAGAAGAEGVIVDLRSPGYQAIGMPDGDGVGARTVSLRVAQRGASGRHIGDVVAKRIRGQAARHLLEAGEGIADPHELVAALGERWPAKLEAPASGRRGTLTLFVAD